jgi:hypothetical protein
MVTKIVLWCLIFVAVASILKPAPNSFDSKMWIIGNLFIISLSAFGLWTRKANK